jgi:hypothetical protein
LDKGGNLFKAIYTETRELKQVKWISFDPSGNWKEGKGTTGVCRMVDGEPQELTQIHAGDFETPEAYWQEHIDLIMREFPDVLVCEGYRLYNHAGKKADIQANSELETPQLIGIIKQTCYQLKIPLFIQFAVEVKTRWKDDLLVKKGYLEKRGRYYYFNGDVTSTHKRDSLRHAIHWWKYKREKAGIK